MSESGTRNNALLIIAIVAIVLVLVCCCLTVVGLAVGGILPLTRSEVFTARVEATESIEKAFDVGTLASLAVNVNVGDVIIEASDDNEVRILALKHAWGRDLEQAEDYLNDFEVRIRETATGKIEIETEIPSRLRRIGRTPSVDLEITVPRDAELDIIVNVGEVEVTGVEGTFDIRSNVGDVYLQDVRFEGDSQIKSDVGNIELHLPGDIAFAFSAQTNVGDIRVDFDVQNERSDEKVVGGKVEGEIGPSPIVSVELETNTGDIQIRRSY